MSMIWTETLHLTNIQTTSNLLLCTDNVTIHHSYSRH